MNQKVERSPDKDLGYVPQCKWLGCYTAKTKVSTTAHSKGRKFHYPERKLSFLGSLASRFSPGSSQWESWWEIERQVEGRPWGIFPPPHS